MDAAVFPGQGSQKPGMAQDFVEHSPISRATFDAASDALGEDLAALCFQDDPRLNLTENTQPAILTAEIAMFRALQDDYGFQPTIFAGHSLGEYAALVAAGVIPLEEAVPLVRLRGQLMQQAVPPDQGAMTALIGEIPGDLTDRIQNLQIDIANHNAPTQLVLSGTIEDITQAEARLQGSGLRMRRLTVSAPFHSRLMRPIEAPFREALVRSSGRWEATHTGRVLSNASGGFYPADDLEAVIAGLTAQLAGTVRWVDNMKAIQGRAPERIVEIGPKRPLRGFFRGLGVEVTAITNRTMARRAFGG
ncbi:MAG: ACP S-malonyltransferase [Myxococcota bacterium]